MGDGQKKEASQQMFVKLLFGLGPADLFLIPSIAASIKMLFLYFITQVSQ